MKKVKLGDTLLSLKTGLNPRKNFKLNTDNADNYYITVRELSGVNVDFLPQTDKVSSEALLLINNRSNLEVGDVLFSGTGTIGKTAIIKEKPYNWNIKEGVYALKPNKDIIDSNYLLYLLQEYVKIGAFDGKTAGSTLFSVPMQVLSDFEVVIPSLSKQKSIASILIALDSKIEINKKINQELEQLARDLYNYWFVQFDFPDSKGKPYKSSGGKMVYSKEVKCDIPFGWDVKKVSNIIKVQKSGDWGKEEPQGNYSEKVNVIRGADLNGLLGNQELNSPERYILKKNTNKILEPGDFIIEISGGSPTQSTGRIAYINTEVLEQFDNPVISSNFTRAISVTDPTLWGYFYFTWSSLYDSNVFFGYEGKTSGIKNLLFERFITENSLIIPDYNLLKVFENFTENILKKIQKNNQQSIKLSKIRNELLPMLMNNQVSINK